MNQDTVVSLATQAMTLAVEIAGHYLKSALEAGEGIGREMYSLTVAETLAHLDAVVTEMQAQPA